MMTIRERAESFLRTRKAGMRCEGGIMDGNIVRTDGGGWLEVPVLSGEGKFSQVYEVAWDESDVPFWRFLREE